MQPEAGEKKRSTWRRWLPVLAFLPFVLFYIFYIVAPRAIGGILEGSLEDALGKPVEVSGVRFNPLARSAAINRITVHYPDSAGIGRSTPYATIDDARITGLGGLLSDPREIDSLRVDEVTINLRRNDNARLWDSPRNADAARAPRERSESRDRERTPREREPFAIPFRSVEINRALMTLEHVDARIAPTEFSISRLIAARDADIRDEATLTLARGEWLHSNREVVSLEEFEWRFSFAHPEASLARLEIDLARPGRMPRVAEAWRAAERFFEKPERDRDDTEDEAIDELFAALRGSFAPSPRDPDSAEDPTGTAFELRVPSILLRSMLGEATDAEARFDYRATRDGEGLATLELPGLIATLRSSISDDVLEWMLVVGLDEFPLADYLAAFAPADASGAGPRIRSANATGEIITAGRGEEISGSGTLRFEAIDVETDPRPMLERLASPSRLAPLVSILRGPALPDDPTRTRELEWVIPPTEIADPIAALLLHATGIQAAASGITTGDEPVQVDTADPFAF